jgi:hypothetical protein
LASSKRQQAFRDEQKAAIDAWEIPLEPGHNCRRDDPVLYSTVSDWYRHHHGRVPSIMAVGLSQRMKTHNETFAEAWAALVDKQIILIEPKAVPKP